MFKSAKSVRMLVFALVILALAFSSIACEGSGGGDGDGNVVSESVNVVLGKAFSNDVAVSTDGHCYDTSGIVAIEVPCP